MNFKQFIKKLPNEVLNKYLINLFNYRNNHEVLYFINERHNFKDWIDYAFSWSGTPEGDDYWCNIMNLHIMQDG